MSRYTSKHTGPEIDAGIDRAKAGGAIDMLLSNKAPAGYGLGSAAKFLTNADDVNTIWQSGNYGWTKSAPANAPVLSVSGAEYGYMRVDCFNSLNFTQTYRSMFSDVIGCVLIRTCREGVFQPDEWMNPPMKLGVEYRTTERFNGNPVYCIYINFGTNTNGANVYVGEDVKEIVRHAEYAGTQNPAPFYNGNHWPNDYTGVFQAEVAINPNTQKKAAKLFCYVNSGYSGKDRNVRAAVYYTKTTD